jgi:(p)ppGpp synthase/HD superfamily hydrolase
MSNLERAIAIAVEAHQGQIDKAGQPYILHPLRVMLRLDTEDERIVGVLHDVVEDCQDKGWSFEALENEGFSNEVIVGLKSVTKEDTSQNDEERYMKFVMRAASNAIGRKVKMADLYDNCDLTRIANPTTKDHDRIAKYYKAIKLIESLS